MIKLLVVLLATFSFTFAHADAAKVKAALQKKYPQFENIEQVHKANILGLYEVVMQGQLFYTDEKTQYLIVGNIIDLKTNRNLSEERSRKLFAIDFDKLPFELAIKKVTGSGQRKMAQFTDPNCGFCKRLEQELSKVSDITLYSFLHPALPGSDEIVQNVLCSNNPVKAWDDWMLDGIAPKKASCDTPTAKVMEFGKTLNVTGTPTLIFADGVIVPGFIPAAEIEKALNGTPGK